MLFRYGPSGASSAFSVGASSACRQPLKYQNYVRCIEMTPKLVQFCDDPQNIHKFFITPQNIHFSDNPKNIEIQNVEPTYT